MSRADLRKKALFAPESSLDSSTRNVGTPSAARHKKNGAALGRQQKRINKKGLFPNCAKLPVFYFFLF